MVTAPVRPHAKYPGIYKAALEISYDNGGINRWRSEEKHRRDFDRFMARRDSYAPHLEAIDAWLGALTGDELQQVCSGEESATIQFMKDRKAPVFTHDLLNHIFEDVG